MANIDMAERGFGKLKRKKSKWNKKVTSVKMKKKFK
jgi:hypothetical protein